MIVIIIWLEKNFWFFFFLATIIIYTQKLGSIKITSKSKWNFQKRTHNIFALCIWFCWGNFVDDFLFRYYCEELFFSFLSFCSSVFMQQNSFFAIINWDFHLKLRLVLSKYDGIYWVSIDDIMLKKERNKEKEKYFDFIV